MKKLILIFLITIIYSQFIIGQSSGFYYKYDFKSYLVSKTQNPNEYFQKIQENIKYMPIARENEIEGKLEFLLVNNGNNESEIILKHHGLRSKIESFNENYLPYLGFEAEVRLAFEKVDDKLLINNTEKFMTEFSILFEIESSNSSSKEERDADFIIKGKRVEKGQKSKVSH